MEPTSDVQYELADGHRRIGPQARYFDECGIPWHWAADVGERAASFEERGHGAYVWVRDESTHRHRIEKSAADRELRESQHLAHRRCVWNQTMQAFMAACNVAIAAEKERKEASQTPPDSDEDEDENVDENEQREAPPSRKRMRSQPHADADAQLRAAGYTISTRQRPNGGRLDLIIRSPSGGTFRSKAAAIRAIDQGRTGGE